MFNDDLLNKIKNEMPKIMDQVKSMSNEQLIQSLEKQMNDPSLPAELKQYLASKKQDFLTAAIETRKKLNF